MKTGISGSVQSTIAAETQSRANRTTTTSTGDDRRQRDLRHVAGRGSRRASRSRVSPASSARPERAARRARSPGPAARRATRTSRARSTVPRSSRPARPSRRGRARPRAAPPARRASGPRRRSARRAATPARPGAAPSPRRGRRRQRRRSAPTVRAATACDRAPRAHARRTRARWLRPMRVMTSELRLAYRRPERPKERDVRRRPHCQSDHGRATGPEAHGRRRPATTSIPARAGCCSRGSCSPSWAG